MISSSLKKVSCAYLSVHARFPVHIYQPHDSHRNLFLALTGKWSAFRSWLPGLYGYGRFTIYNETHAQYSQVLDHLGGVSEDTVTIVQETHGPRGASL